MTTGKKLWPTLLLLILPIAFSATLLAQYDQDDPPGSIARISYLQGGVSLQAYGSDDWSQAPVNYPMVGGDRLYTGGGSRAVVQLGGAELRVWQLTDVTLTNQTDNYQQIGLASGYLRLHVSQMNPGSQIEVDTPNDAVIVERPGDYRIEAFPQNGSSIVIVNSGNAQITGPGINQPLSSGYSVGLFGKNPTALQYLDVPDYDDLDYWSFDLDRRLENSISARYVSRQMVGYGDLDSYGSWNPNTEYGPVWYPNSVPDGWRPYSTGHWAYVQPWGYTWVDDAPWGFAPFHYGRWAMVDGRWGWAPGPREVRPVYSPALVAFVGGGPGGGGGGGISINIGSGGGGGVAAWFPIGIGEPYVPWYRCSPNYARQVNTTNVNVAAIHNTTIVNNYNAYINKTVNNNKSVDNITVDNITVDNTTVNNTTVNNTTVNNFNYANRGQAVAVPVSTMVNGSSVSRQAVRLTPQQQQQIARAPVAIRPTAPTPVVAHSSLVTATNVTRPVARPVLMTLTGQAKAVPSAVRPQPVVVSSLPPARVVPQNAPPAAAPKSVPVTQPAAGSRPVPVAPVIQQPAAPIARPAQPPPIVTAPVNRPPPMIQPAPAPIARPQVPQQPQPAAPAQPQRPQQPVKLPVSQPTPQTPAQKPVPRPAPQPTERQVPAPIARPVPPPQLRPAPPPPIQEIRPAPLRPAPTPTPAPPPVLQRPAPAPVRPQPIQPSNKPAPRPDNKQLPPKDELKQEHPN